MNACLFLALLSTSALAAVKSEDLTLRDEKRGRDIECQVHFTSVGEKLPLVIFSHGFGADRTAFAEISRHVAEQGYVIVHPSHADGFGRSGASRPGSARSAQAAGLRDC